MSLIFYLGEEPEHHLVPGKHLEKLRACVLRMMNQREVCEIGALFVNPFKIVNIFSGVEEAVRDQEDRDRPLEDTTTRYAIFSTIALNTVSSSLFAKVETSSVCMYYNPFTLDECAS